MYIKKISILFIIALFLCGATFGANVSVSPSNVPKGAYVNGSDGDQNFFQTITITLLEDGSETWGTDGTDVIVVSFPNDITLADVDEDGSFDDEVAVSAEYSESNPSITVSAANTTANQIQLTPGTPGNLEAGDKINVMFPIVTAEVPAAGTADYTVSYGDDGATEVEDGNDTPTVTFVDNLSEVIFTDDYRDGDETSNLGKVYPSSPAAVTSNLPDFVVERDFSMYIPTPDLSSNPGWDVADEWSYNAGELQIQDSDDNNDVNTLSNSNLDPVVEDNENYAFIYDITNGAGGFTNTNSTMELSGIHAGAALDVTAAGTDKVTFFQSTGTASSSDIVLTLIDGAANDADFGIDNIYLADEYLVDNQGLIAGAWNGTNFAGDPAAFDGSANASGSLVLPNASIDETIVNNARYRLVLTLDVTNAEADGDATPTLHITSGFASTQTNIADDGGTGGIGDLSNASTQQVEVFFTSASNASSQDFTIEVSGVDVGDADDPVFTIDNVSLTRVGTEATVSGDFLTANNDNTDDITYTFWASQNPNLTKVDEQNGHRPIAYYTDTGGDEATENTADDPVAIENEGETFDDTQLDGRLLEEGTWYFYVTSDVTGDWVLGSSDSLNVKHYPVFAAGELGGGIDYDGDGAYEPGAAANDNYAGNNAMYLNSGSGNGLGKDGILGGVNVETADIHWNVEDVDENASVKIFLSEESSLPSMTKSNLMAKVASEEGTFQIGPDTLSEEGTSSTYYNYDIYTSATDYERAGDYYIYVLAEDSDTSSVLQVVDDDDDPVEFYVKHFPIMTLQNTEYAHDEVAQGSTGDAIEINTAHQQYFSINWGQTIDGDNDGDGTATIKLYASSINKNDGAPQEVAVGWDSDGNDRVAGDVDTTALADSASASPASHCLIATIRDTSDTRKANRYFWDVRNSGLDAGSYYIYAVITENGDANMYQLNDGGADNEIIISHGEYVLFSNPPEREEGNYLNLNQTDRFQFKWDAFDKDATASDFVGALFMIEDGYEDMIDDLDGNWDMSDIDDGAITHLSEGDFTTTTKWTAGGAWDLSGGNATFLNASGAAATLLLTQSESDIKYEVEGGTDYILEYTVSGVADVPAANVTADFADAPTALTLTNGEQKTTITTAANPGDFIIEVTAGDAADGFILDDIRLYKAGTAYWLTGSSDGDDIPAAGVQLSDGSAEVDFGSIVQEMSDGSDDSELAPAGDYHVYMVWADDGDLDDDDAETIEKAPGMISFTDFSDPSTDFELSPNRVTAEKGDTIDLDIYAADGGTNNAMIISTYLNIPSSKFSVVDQEENVANIQPWIEDTSPFDGTAFVDTLGESGGYYYIDHVYYADNETGYSLGATPVKIGTIQLVVEENNTSGGVETHEITFNSTSPRKTVIKDVNNNDYVSTVPEVAAKIQLATPGMIKGNIDLEGRDNEGEEVNIFVCDEGSMEMIDDTTFLQANGLENDDDTLSVTLGAGGSYTISQVPTGTYDIIVRKDGWADQRIESQSVNQLSELVVDFEGSDKLLAGDVAGYTTEDGITIPDGRIEGEDQNAFESAFNSQSDDDNWNAYCDITADGRVNVEDFNYFIKNEDNNGEQLLYKQVKGNNKNAVIEMQEIEAAAGKAVYDIFVEDISNVRAYELEMNIDHSAYKIVSYQDGLSKHFNTGNFIKSSKGSMFFVSGIRGLNTVANTEIKLARITLEKKVADAPEPEIYTAKVIDANNRAVDARLKDEVLPSEFALEDNYPNPFNPTTNIKFAMPEAGNVKLTIYNMIGQKVRTLVSNKMEAGRYNIQWNARNDFGAKVASGLYFYRMQVDGKHIGSRKMVLMK